MDEAAFHRHYADLDACFAAVLGEIYDEFFARAQEAVAGAERLARPHARHRLCAAPLPARRRARRPPRRGRGPACRRARRSELFLETFNRLVDLIDEGCAEAGGPESPGLATALGVGGVVFARIQEAVAEGELGLGEEEIPELMYAAVFPYLGAEAAEEELRIPPPPDPSL